MDDTHSTYPISLREVNLSAMSTIVIMSSLKVYFIASYFDSHLLVTRVTQRIYEKNARKCLYQPFYQLNHFSHWKTTIYYILLALLLLLLMLNMISHHCPQKMKRPLLLWILSNVGRLAIIFLRAYSFYKNNNSRTSRQRTNYEQSSPQNSYHKVNIFKVK